MLQWRLRRTKEGGIEGRVRRREKLAELGLRSQGRAGEEWPAVCVPGKDRKKVGAHLAIPPVPIMCSQLQARRQHVTELVGVPGRACSAPEAQTPPFQLEWNGVAIEGRCYKTSPHTHPVDAHAYIVSLDNSIHVTGCLVVRDQAIIASSRQGWCWAFGLCAEDVGGADVLFYNVAMSYTCAAPQIYLACSVSVRTFLPVRIFR